MSDSNGIAQVQDKRPRIAGLMPRNAQTLALGGIALLMMLIILFSGHNTPKSAPPPPPAIPAVTQADRTRIQDYRNVLDEQMRKLAIEEAALAHTKRAVGEEVSGAGLSPRPSSLGYADVSTGERGQNGNWVEADRQKHDYQSLFASNLALTYRSSAAKADPQSVPPNPNVVTPQTSLAPPVAQYRLFEGTLIETVLTNRLDSSFSGPINCLVTTNVYSHDGQALLIPQGSRVLGEVRKLEAFGEQRLAVFFHRLIMPDGFSVSLDQFKGLDQLGETGLLDQVNHHYTEIFGVSLAVGAIAGLAQSSTRYGLTESSSDAYEQGVSSSLSQSALHILDRYLNVLPTFTIREGYRIKIYLSQDLLLPAVGQHPERNDL